jgi:branched-chain amino acid transport system permease protein
MFDKPLIRSVSWARSAAGISILVTVALAAFATMDRGPGILINTIVLGGMLALMSMGLALVLGVLNIPHFALGEFFMIGTLIGYYVFTPLCSYLSANPNAVLAALAPLLAIFSGFLGGGIVGALSEKLVFSELRKRSRENWVMNSFLLTVGLSVILVNATQILFGTSFKGIVRYWAGPPFEIYGDFISRDRVFAFLLAIAIIVVFALFMSRTRTGRAIRAVSQDETGALMVGIDLNAIMVLTMGLSCALAAVAGGSLLFMYPSYPTVGLEPLYMAWFVVILAGLGNVMGALAGGFIVALLKVLTVEYVGAGWDFVIPSAAIILVLLFKPNGIFGSEVLGILEK